MPRHSLTAPGFGKVEVASRVDRYLSTVTAVERLELHDDVANPAPGKPGADQPEAEAQSVGHAARVVAGALRAEGVERVHVAVIGLGADHFHQHLYPRYPGGPAETPWMEVDDLPDAPHGGADEIIALVERLRRHL